MNLVIQYLLKVQLPILILFIVSMYSFGMNIPLFLVSVFLIQTVGISVGFHRYFSHKGFETYTIVKILMGILGSLAIIGGPVGWSLVHRQHHKYSDQPGDPHSPKDGFWHSAYFWAYSFNITPLMIANVRDLYRDKVTVTIERYSAVLPYVFIVVAAIVDTTFIASVTGAMFTVLLMESSLNCLFHSSTGKLYNSALLSPIFGGSCLHKNHHESYNVNFSKAWYELDTGYWIIKLIRK